MLVSGMNLLFSQDSSKVSVYLITCGPGTETYSIYGHCALRITDPSKGQDLAYNWGVFDFATPHFVWKFAKGRLDYMLGVYNFNSFLREYFAEKRWVQSQKINLEPAEIAAIQALIAENLKPENVKYRYDFFYDNCATRIRDILEKALGRKLVYPEESGKDLPTFRDKIGQYERPYPWLKFGTDLLIGTPAEKKVTFRSKMFLPLDIQEGLSEVVINRNGKMIPLLQNPETLVDFNTPAVKPEFFTSPVVVFTILLIGIIVMFALAKNRKLIKNADIVIFSVFSILALIMIFFSFFTDHMELRKNLNIIWLSPFVIICLAAIILNKRWQLWFRIVFYLCAVSLVLQLVIPYAFNDAFLPLLIILLIRSSARAEFSWNPLGIQSI